MALQKLLHRQSLTLLEITIVLIVLSILLAIGVGRIVSISREAHLASEEAIIRAVKAGIQAYQIDSVLNDRIPAYPALLDAAPVGSRASRDNPFFTNVLETISVNRGSWQKESESTYRGPSGTVYAYDNTSGIFTD